MQEYKIDCKLFLSIIFKINSYKDMLKWLENNENINYITKFRIINYSFLVYCNKNILISDEIVNIYITFFKSVLYQDLIDFIQKTYPKKNISSTKLFDIFYTTSNIYSFLEYTKHNANLLNVEEYNLDPHRYIHNNFIKYIITKIKKI